MARTLSTPDFSSKFAVSFAVIDSLPEVFLSALAYPKYGMTAVICLAEALLQASTIIINSIKLSLTGAHVG